MIRKSIWMFAGQGSQYYLMGRELLETEPLFRREMERADQVTRDLVGESLINIIYGSGHDRSEPFKRVLFSSPAIVAVECALVELLRSRGLEPDFLLGHSLGEVSCLVTAGVIPLEDALVVVIKLSELLEYCAPAGGMLAVLDSPELAGQNPAEFDGCEVAGLNFNRSFLVSGLAGPLARLQRFLKARGILVVELPVAFAFHSRWTDMVATPARSLLEKLPVTAPRIPVISAVRCGLVQECSGTHLWEATRGRVDFARTIRELEKSGPFQYVDLGPSGSMATAVKYNLEPGSNSTFASIMTPFGQETKHLERLLAAGRG